MGISFIILLQKSEMKVMFLPSSARMNKQKLFFIQNDEVSNGQCIKMEKEKDQET
jgi:hypothetical protein